MVSSLSCALVSSGRCAAICPLSWRVRCSLAKLSGIVVLCHIASSEVSSDALSLVPNSV